ncbi:cytochrome P450 [Mycolicibacterium helvum]|uniref:Steroid C26-monooxygenase n=1 Tax=Mycolicibacterium helvum TaxID=1534349 RepID=A0A7I7T9I3_9MYCO|nr:cytochrome P450 [Mycolicibacterium helvum]BBY64975.1 cytochrome P-450 like protein [Mycolicibacterium helvum]
MVSAVSNASAAELITDLVVGGIADPYPLYEQLREMGTGVHWSDVLGGWVATRYDDVKSMVTRSAEFSSDTFYDGAPSAHNPEDSEHRRFISISSRQFIFQDPPVHTRIRSIFRHAFTRTSIARWRPMMEEVTDEVLARYQPGEELDIMPHFAADIPVAVIASILGVPKDKWAELRHWSEAYGRTLDPGVQGNLRDSSIRIALEMMDYLSDLVAQRRADPRDDLITLIATTEADDGGCLTDEEAISQITLLLAAGNDTTTALIGSAMTIMIDRPDVKAALLDDPARIAGAIEEMLRFDPPFHLNFRKAKADAEYGGQQIRTGQMCFQVIAAANRDPRQFDNPGVIDIDRDASRHLAFSHGIHHCVGAPLARMEGEVVLRKLLERFPDFAAGTAPAARRTHNILARTWNCRPVTL